MKCAPTKVQSSFCHGSGSMKFHVPSIERGNSLFARGLACKVHTHRVSYTCSISKKQRKHQNTKKHQNTYPTGGPHAHRTKTNKFMFMAQVCGHAEVFVFFAWLCGRCCLHSVFGVCGRCCLQSVFGLYGRCCLQSVFGVRGRCCLQSVFGVRGRCCLQSVFGTLLFAKRWDDASGVCIWRLPAAECPTFTSLFRRSRLCPQSKAYTQPL